MDQGTARRLVLVSMLVTGAVVMYDIFSHKGKLGPGQTFRAVWSLSLLFLLLSIMADTVPGLAGPFSALVALSTAIGREGAVASIVKVGGSAAPTTTTTTQKNKGGK